ncbi:MAG TPA: MBL fold metallo-hydrolase [Nitrososphaeraceae archaeon]|nr:MBL fold metallo-hydrolase [Nitrososphaeraceae archaeon]
MTEIKHGVHLIDGLTHPFPGVGMVSYIVEEAPHDLTLIDTCFSSDLLKLEEYLHNAGYEIGDIKRIVITHIHSDHTQAVNEIKKRSGGALEILSHWTEAAYLNHNPPYSGPPTHETILSFFNQLGLKPEDIFKKYGTFDVEPIKVDRQLQDGDMVGKSLQVIHTPGHTPGHISLYSNQHGIIFGGDVMSKSVMGIDGLFVPPSTLSIDSTTGAISARRISNLKFDTLLLAHQDAPLLENASKEVQRSIAALNIRKP